MQMKHDSCYWSDCILTMEKGNCKTKLNANTAPYLIFITVF